MNYHNIVKDDMLNGAGLRVTLFVSGCSHACKGCHNPQTWDPNSGILFDDEAEKEILDYLSQDYVSGITFSGGDPLYPGNRECLTNLAKKIKTLYPNKNIWCYTGFLLEEVKDLEILSYVDVLVEGEFKIDLLSPDKPWVGSENQNVIDLHSGQILYSDSQKEIQQGQRCSCGC